MNSTFKVLILVALLALVYSMGRFETKWLSQTKRVDSTVRILTSENAHWIMELDQSRPHTEGLVIKGSGAGSNYPLLMIRDFKGAPIAWVAPHGGLTVTDNIRVRSGVFDDDCVSLRRWTDGKKLSGAGGFSWDGDRLVQKTVGDAGDAEPLPDRPELWLRVIDNTGDDPRHLLIPAFREK